MSSSFGLVLAGGGIGFAIGFVLVAIVASVAWQRSGNGRVEEVYVPDPKVAELERLLHFSQGQTAKVQAELEAARAQTEELVAAAHQKVASQMRILETRVEFLNEQGERRAERLMTKEREVADMEMRVMVLQRFIDQEMRVPGYAVEVRQQERMDVARRLRFEEGWSKKRIALRIYGYTGGAACRLVRRAIESAPGGTPGGTGTAIEVYQGGYSATD